MIENIKENGRADLHHTLNTIDLEDPEGFARSNDGYRRDAFYRFNQTYQYLFDIIGEDRHDVRLAAAAKHMRRGGFETRPYVVRPGRCRYR